MKSWSELESVQPLAFKILTNSIRNNRISHAYLINGQQGTGKKTLANLFVMSMFCQDRNDVEPCFECLACKRVMSGNHPDVYWIEKDGNSIKNEQVDTLRKEFSYASNESNRRIYVINDAETLTVNAANRLLKFLEEPVIETTAILLTSNVQSVIPTIRSRCQLLDLLPIDKESMQGKLIDLEIDENNAHLLSALTNNLDEAIIYNDEAKVYVARDLVVQLIEMLVHNYDERFLFIHQHWLTNFKDRKDIDVALDILLLACNDIVKHQIDSEDVESSLLPSETISKAAYKFTQRRLLEGIKSILATKQKLRQNINPTLAMEEFVLRL